MGYSYTVQRSPLHSSRGYYGYPSMPTGITIHWWGSPGAGFTHDGVADYLCRPNGNTSAHEVISDGRVTHLVDFDRAAWHSGSTEGNGSTIGLECRPEMTAGDLETLAQRCADIEKHLGRSMYYYGHKDWYATACPGTYYDRTGWLIRRVNEIHAGVEGDMSAEAERKIDEMHQWAKGFFVESVKNPYYDGKKDTNKTIYASTALDWITNWLHNYLVESIPNPHGGDNETVWARTALDWTTHWVFQMRAEIAAQGKAIEALSADPNITAERFEQIVRDAVQQNIHITGNVEITGEQQ